MSRDSTIQRQLAERRAKEPVGMTALRSENQRLRVALQCAQKTFADIGNRDQVDEIEDALNPGWREKWTR